MKLAFESDIKSLNLSDFWICEKIAESVELGFEFRRIPTRRTRSPNQISLGEYSQLQGKNLQ